MILPLLLRAWAFEPVVEELEGGAVDWSNLRLVVHASSEGSSGAMTNLQTAEGDARDQLGPNFEKLARSVRVDRDRLAGALLDAEDAVADRLRSNLAAWEVFEARYLAGGRVELDAALSLQSWLRPALVTLATTPEREAVVGGATGLVVDARAIKVNCALAPEFVDTAGGHLFGLADVTSYAASQRAPVVYVHDPADPIAVRRAGASPVFVKPDRAQNGVDLVFGPAAAAALRELAERSEVLLHGQIVVVVAP